MLAEEHSTAFTLIKGVVRGVTGAGPAGDLGDGLSTAIVLSDGSRVGLAYWRLIKNGRVLVTSIENGQSRSGPPIDAFEELRSHIVGTECLGVELDPVTWDLTILLSGDILVQAFRFRSLFEDWEVTLPNGDSYWSNHIA